MKKTPSTEPSVIKKAEQQIEKISKSDRRFTLDLRNYNLTTEDLEKLIPIIKQKLPELDTLLLDKNKLIRLPDNINELSKLETLNFGENDITYLTESTIDHLCKINCKVLLSENPLSPETLLKINAVENWENIFCLDEIQKRQLKEILTSGQDKTSGNETDLTKFSQAQNSEKSAQKNETPRAQQDRNSKRGTKKRGALGVMPY